MTSLTARAGRSSVGSLGGRLLAGILPYLGVIVMIVLLVTYFAATQPRFLTTANLVNILEAASVLLIISIGLTVVLLVAGFDLSVSGVLVLSGVCLGKMLEAGIPTVPALILCVIGGALIGLILMGIPVAKADMDPFILSIGLLSATGGLALLIANGEELSLYEESAVRALGTGKIVGIPVPVVIALSILALTFFVLRYTGFGRRLYAVGGNPEAARLAGINVFWVRVSAYVFCSALAALAGVIDAGRLASASPTADTAITLTAIAAILLGGISLLGGSGSVIGTFLGVIFLGVLSNGLILASISIYWQGLVTGVVLLASVGIDHLRRSHSRRETEG